MNTTSLKPSATPSTTHPDDVPPIARNTSQPDTPNSSPPRRTDARTELSQNSVHDSEIDVFLRERSSVSEVALPASASDASATRAATAKTKNPFVLLIVPSLNSRVVKPRRDRP